MFIPETYTIIAFIFPRLLGFIYFCAIGAFIFQIKGLIGKNGILPISNYLSWMATHYPKKKYFYLPSLFWFNSSDRALMSVVLLGTLLSVLLMLGIYPALMLFLLYWIHLSIVSAGQDFLSFGWEGFLLEITAQTFLVSLTDIPNLFVWISLNFLLFRFHIQAGAVKLQSQDPSWRNLTAVAYHTQTQPLPNAVAWYAHKLPLWMQKLSVLVMFAIELLIPFGMFWHETIRLGVFIALVSLQFFIWLTGNFSYLNYLTAAFCTILLSNKVLSPFFSVPHSEPTSFYLDIVLSATGILLIGLQAMRVWDQFLPNQSIKRALYWLHPFHLANRYGIFAVMTTARYEIIIEGSDDRQTWKEYIFRYKPSEITRRPRWIAPYQPRLDWQVWFLPFREFYEEEWFQKFLFHLLKGTPEVLSLLRGNPFPNIPPKYIRVQLYQYEFSSFKEKREKGWWWKRKFASSYSPILSLAAHLTQKEQNE